MVVVLELLPLLLLLPLALVVVIPIFHRRGRLPPSPIAIPIIGHFHLLGPLLHSSLRDLSLRWGPFFSLRLGYVPCVVVSSPELAREFLKTNELSFSSRIDSATIDRLTYGSSMAFAPVEAYWKFIRKLTMNELLGNSPVRGLASLRTRELCHFLRILADKAERGEAANISGELQQLTYAVIFQMVCGSAAAATSGMDRGRVEEARTVVREVTKIFGEFNLSDYVWFPKRLDLQGFRKRTEEIFRRFDTLIEAVLCEREELRRMRKGEEEEEGVKGTDFLDILLDHLEDQKDENVPFTRLHVKGLIIV
ncbi:Licodione synthase [Morus notabilis]|uniref:Licodione synthase n=1 Tax=Morus notabilis TaxID=981085 RepID=W9S004_9ROSA|nr:Licodione synthase [Morus notabilis]